MKFNDRYEIIGDFDFVMKLIKKYKISYINYPLINYRDHKNNRTKIKFFLRLNEMDFWIKKQISSKKYRPEDIKSLILKNNYWKCKFYLERKKFKEFKLNYKKIPLGIEKMKLITLFIKSSFLYG